MRIDHSPSFFDDSGRVYLALVLVIIGYVPFFLSLAYKIPSFAAFRTNYTLTAR